MRKLTILFLSLILLFPLVSAVTECQRITPLKDIPCRQPLSYKPSDSCSNYNISIYNSTNSTIQVLQLQEGTPYCYFVFNITEPGYYPWYGSLEWGNITLEGGDDMASLTVIGFLLVFNVVLFILPFKVRFTFMESIKGDIIDYISKRTIWLISIWLFYYIFLMVAEIGIKQNLGIETGLRGLISIFTLCLYIASGWIAFIVIRVPLKMYNQHLKKLRMGDVAIE